MTLACVLGAAFPAAAQTLAGALDTTNLVWTTGGDAVWFAQTTNTHDGVDAVMGGVVGSNQTSWIETVVVGPATVSFWSVTSGFDSPFLSFAVNYDPSSHIPMNGLNSRGFWSGRTYDLGDGTNVLHWSVSNPFGTINPGFAALDEFSVSPPRPLTINDQPYDAAVYSGESAVFSASAIGTPPIQYQWQWNGTNVLGATNAWIQWEATSTNDSGIYSVIVSNSQGWTNSTNAVLTVLPPSAPFFTYEPESATAFSGQDLYLLADVDGSPPFAFQWRKDGTNLTEMISSSSRWTSFSLTLTNISLADAGSYILVVSNSWGGIESSNAILTVILSVAPVITRQPRSLEVAEGVNTWMEVEATGTPGPYYAWTRVGAVPPSPGSPELAPLIADPYRAFNNVTTNDAGIYFATVSNPGGSVVSRDALLTVLPPMSITGTWGTGAEEVFVTNGLAFLAQGTNGLAILSVSNPASPQWLGSCDTAGYASAVCVSGNLAFVADGSAGLQVISVTNPANPVLVGSYNTPGYANDVVVRSNLAYVADGSAGLLILNVSNPASPSVVGGYSTNLRASSIGLSGVLAFISSPFPDARPGTNVAGMLIVNIADPTHPVELGRSGMTVQAVDVRNELVFAATRSAMTVIDTSNPVQPCVIASFHYYTNRISVDDVHIVNDLAYMVGYSGEQTTLFVLDVRDPSEPIPVGCFITPGHASTLWVDGNYVYIAGYDSPLLIIETPFNPRPVVPPSLSLVDQGGMKLQFQGRRGIHYTIEYVDGLAGLPWQPLQTVLLTNETSVIEVPSPSGMRFFRLRQLD